MDRLVTALRLHIGSSPHHAITRAQLAERIGRTAYYVDDILAGEAKVTFVDGVNLIGVLDEIAPASAEAVLAEAGWRKAVERDASPTGLAGVESALAEATARVRLLRGSGGPA